MKILVNILNALLILFFSILIASFYGVFHNLISYSVSPEFFEKFLFPNFGVNEWGISDPLIKASFVGILGTYWLGFYFGLVYVFIYFFLKPAKKLKIIINAILLNIGIAALGSLASLLIALIFIAPEKSTFVIEYKPQYMESFLYASSMHTGSYIGGAIGLIIALIYIFKTGRTKKDTPEGVPDI